MKKIISLILVLIVAVSCTTDVKTYNPGFQAYRDGTLFRALDMSATKSASTGVVKLKALAQDEELNISIASISKGTYYLGTTNSNTFASYRSTFNGTNLYYSTATTSGPVSNVSSPTAAGTGYTTDFITSGGVDVANNSHATTTTGSGFGLTVSVKTNSTGGVIYGKVSSPGNNYTPGDVITVTGGTTSAKFTVLNVDGSNGEIVITDNNGGIITGTFKFNAVNILGTSMVNFQYGNFYKIPVNSVP